MMTEQNLDRMCIVSARCQDKQCTGDCVKPKVVWKQLLWICPNMRHANGNLIETDIESGKRCIIFFRSSQNKKEIPDKFIP